MSTGNIVLFVFGAIIISIAVGLTVAGGTMIWVDRAITDEEGYLTTKTVKYDTDSSTIIAEPDDIDAGPAGDLSGGDIVSFRVEPVNSGTSGNILETLTLLMGNREEASADLSIVVRAKVSWLFEVGLGLLVGGLMVLAGGGVAVFFALRNSLRHFELWNRLMNRELSADID